MKTEKQIAIMEKEIGKKIENKINDLDKIEISDIDDFFNNTINFKNGQLLNYTPILKDGVLIQQCDEVVGYLIFSTSDISDVFIGKTKKEDTINEQCIDIPIEEIQQALSDGMEPIDTQVIMIHVDSAQKVKPEYYLGKMTEYEKSLFKNGMKKNPSRYAQFKKDFLDAPVRWIYSCDVFVIPHVKDTFSVLYANFSTPESEVFKKQNRKYSYRPEYIEEKTKDVNSLLLSMAWLNYVNEHPEIKHIEKDEQKRNEKTTDIKDIEKIHKNTERKIILNGLKIISGDTEFIKKLSSKKRQRFIESWNVRGHYRHYASGKVTYVKPYVKGKKDGKITPKTYVAK